MCSISVAVLEASIQCLEWHCSDIVVPFPFVGSGGVLFPLAVYDPFWLCSSEMVICI
jgi:hypothetical protein